MKKSDLTREELDELVSTLTALRGCLPDDVTDEINKLELAYGGAFGEPPTRAATLADQIAASLRASSGL